VFPFLFVSLWCFSFFNRVLTLLRKSMRRECKLEPLCGHLWSILGRVQVVSASIRQKGCICAHGTSAWYASSWKEEGGAAVVYNVQARGSASRCRDTAPFKMASTIGHCSNFRCPSLLFPFIITVCFSLGSFRFVSGLNPMSDLSLPSEAKWVLILISFAYNSFPPLWFDCNLFDPSRPFPIVDSLLSFS
jgi:hypothetical protein